MQKNQHNATRAAEAGATAQTSAATTPFPQAERPRGGSPIALKAGPRAFEVLLGSWSHGMGRPSSDADWRGVFVSGPSQWAEPLAALQEERADLAADGVDAVFWSQWRFAQLLGQGNFMALKPLFCDEALIELDRGPLAQLRERRELFLSKQTIDGLGGVALAQLRVLDKIAAKPAAAGKEEKPGKVASHALRLARMSLEVARDGQFNVRRLDSAELLAIKAGERPWADAAREAQDTARQSRALRQRSGLPDEGAEEWAREWARALFHEELARRGADFALWADQPGTGLALPRQPAEELQEEPQAKPAERQGNRRSARR